MHALTTPLITKADGTKFGKTESGTVWLDPELTTPVRVLPVLAQRRRRRRGALPQGVQLPVARARSRSSRRRSRERPAAREAQRALAYEVTSLVHGTAAADQVVAASQALFGRGSLADLDAATLAAAVAELPSAPRCGRRLDRRPARGHGRRREQGGRPTRDRRGRGVGQQRPGGRRGRRAHRGRPPARPLGGAAPRQADPRGRRRAGLSARTRPTSRGPASRAGVVTGSDRRPFHA